MARSEKNLTAVFTDTASAIRAKTGTTETICPLDFADKINAIQTGGGSDSSLRAYFEAGGKCSYSTAKSLDNVINYADTANVSDFSHFFEECTNLTLSPNISTASANGSMKSMFYNCYNLTKSPSNLNTSNITNMRQMFDYCGKLTEVSFMDTSNVTDMGEMFVYCSALTTIPKFDTSKVTTMFYMFNSCKNISIIPELDVSNCEDFSYMFDHCPNITEIHMKGMRVPIDISGSTKFTREALVEILTNFGEPKYSYAKTITIGSTNLAKLTDEDKAIATNKGWNLK